MAAFHLSACTVVPSVRGRIALLGRGIARLGSRGVTVGSLRRGGVAICRSRGITAGHRRGTVGRGRGLQICALAGVLAGVEGGCSVVAALSACGDRLRVHSVPMGIGSRRGGRRSLGGIAVTIIAWSAHVQVVQEGMLDANQFLVGFTDLYMQVANQFDSMRRVKS